MHCILTNPECTLETASLLQALLKHSS